MKAKELRTSRVFGSLNESEASARTEPWAGGPCARPPGRGPSPRWRPGPARRAPAYAAASCPRRRSTARRPRPWRRSPGAAARTCPRTSRSPASCLWKGGTVDGAQKTQRDPRGPRGVPRTGAGAGARARVCGRVCRASACRLCRCEFSGKAGQADSFPLGLGRPRAHPLHGQNKGREWPTVLPPPACPDPAGPTWGVMGSDRGKEARRGPVEESSGSGGHVAMTSSSSSEATSPACPTFMVRPPREAVYGPGRGTRTCFLL